VFLLTSGASNSELFHRRKRREQRGKLPRSTGLRSGLLRFVSTSRRALPRCFLWNECLRPPSPFILSPRRGNRFRLFPVLRMSVRPIPSYRISKERRTILPLLGERAGVRADVNLATWAR
jgi:hypothetical protein